MKKQLLFIHGGMAFSEYDAFLAYLQTCEVSDPLAPPQKRWTKNLPDDLGGDWDVFMPTMPNKQNAKYEEWKIWFERYFQFLHAGVVLVGHSQGGYFLLKYLSENDMPVNVRAVYLLGAPAGPGDFGVEANNFASTPVSRVSGEQPMSLDKVVGGQEDGGDFAFDEKKVGAITQKAECVYIFHSKNDPVVPYSHAETLAELLPEAGPVTFENKGHFLEETFPEFLEHLRKNS